MSQAKAKGLSKRERKKRLKELKRQERERQARVARMKKIGGIAALVVLLAGLAYGGSQWLLNPAFDPPTDTLGHTEGVPESHILTEPMPLPIQKHMLEHADGKERPGVIVSYNCEDFDCEPDLVDQLTQIVQEYPTYVYLAPFPDMDAKIALTRFGKIEKLDGVDEERIRAFIEGTSTTLQ